MTVRKGDHSAHAPPLICVCLPRVIRVHLDRLSMVTPRPSTLHVLGIGQHPNSDADHFSQNWVDLQTRKNNDRIRFTWEECPSLGDAVYRQNFTVPQAVLIRCGSLNEPSVPQDTLLVVTTLPHFLSAYFSWGTPLFVVLRIGQQTGERQGEGAKECPSASRSTPSNQRMNPNAGTFPNRQHVVFWQHSCSKQRQIVSQTQQQLPDGRVKKHTGHVEHRVCGGNSVVH
jgi:hypothetical protein